MDSNDDATLDLATIGPTSMLGRILAVRVLFCREAREELAILLTALAHHWRRTRRVVGNVLGSLLWLVNPRNPSVILAAVVAAMFWIRRTKMQTIKAEQSYRRRFWSNLMASAQTYDEWVHAASMLEKTIDRKRDCDLYDEDLVRSKLNDLRSRRLEGGVEDILFFMRADLVRNLGNMCNPDLHKGRLQMPRLIQEYINEVRYQLRAVCETDSEEFSVDEKIAFITETRHAFGRTALLLSGGAALGAFHLGVVRTLIEHRLLPRVLAGASVGSITCSFCATRTWSELQSFFDDSLPPMHFFESMGSIIATAHRLLTKGAVHEIGSLQRKMRQLIGDLTFQEAYDLSGRVLGISVCSPRKHEPPRYIFLAFFY
jgi:TAG lipase/steryl ester hydrolase/phospholipase A2/LPA acyltransferase